MLERTVSTLDLGSFDISETRGFLPAEDPLYTFGDNVHPHLRYLEQLGAQIPELLESHKLRRTVDSLKPIEGSVFDTLDKRGTVMAARIYAFLASGYVHQIGEPKVRQIPKSVAQPLSELSRRLGRRFPILSYDLYALNNWKRLDPSRGIELENMNTIQNFVKLRDEPWFILVHVEIEAEAGPAVGAIGRLQQAVLTKDVDSLEAALDTVADSLGTAIHTLSRMPEGNSPDLYAFTFRPYIQMFKEITYEGVGDYGPAPTFRGETGAQSSVIPSLDVALGIKHARTDLTDYVADMRNYMPAAHRAFIEEVEKNESERPVRGFISKFGKRRTVECYNRCLDKIIEFRQKHLEFAISYIFTKVEDQSGTGGTPFMKWLAQLRDETKQAKIRL